MVAKQKFIEPYFFLLAHGEGQIFYLFKIFVRILMLIIFSLYHAVELSSCHGNILVTVNKQMMIYMVNSTS